VLETGLSFLQVYGYYFPCFPPQVSDDLLFFSFHLILSSIDSLSVYVRFSNFLNIRRTIKPFQAPHSPNCTLAPLSPPRSFDCIRLLAAKNMVFQVYFIVNVRGISDSSLSLMSHRDVVLRRFRDSVWFFYLGVFLSPFRKLLSHIFPV